MELSLKDIKELIGGNGTNELPFVIGEQYFIRTVTYHVTGKVKAIKGKFLVLETAAWIADSGRFADALASCNFEEVEPFCHDCIINTDSITDATIIGELPTKQK